MVWPLVPVWFGSTRGASIGRVRYHRKRRGFERYV
jgi:hypothetical protein